MLFVRGDSLALHGSLVDMLRGIFTIEQGGGLFKCTTLGLHKEDVEVDGLEGDPADVDDVIPPGELAEGDGVGILRRP